jgi:hypothetical protein
VKKKHPIREVKGVNKDKVIDKASQSLVTGDATPMSPTSIAMADRTTSAKDNTAKPANDALHPVNETAQPANPGNNSADSNAPVLPTPSELTTSTISTTIATAEQMTGSAKDISTPTDKTTQPANHPLHPPAIDDKIPTPFEAPQVNTETNSSRDDNVTMKDATSRISTSLKPHNDQDLPPWLESTIGYLCGLTEDMAWQNLVTYFIVFERQKPTNGVS